MLLLEVYPRLKPFEEAGAARIHLPFRARLDILAPL